MKILYVNTGFYLDNSNGASIATRHMLEALSLRGCHVEALTSNLLELDQGKDFDFRPWFQGAAVENGLSAIEFWEVAEGGGLGLPSHIQFECNSVRNFLFEAKTSRLHKFDETEGRGFMRLFELVVARCRPDVLVNFGGNTLSQSIRAMARSKGIPVVFPLHNFAYGTIDPFLSADAIFTPSRYAAAFYRRTVGIECEVLPNIVNLSRIRALDRVPKYLTYINPSIEKGVYVFARIADELGRQRPDIPILVVEARGSEVTLAGCGLDLTLHGNVFLMSNSNDPRHFWGVTRVCLMPSLWRENQPLVAVEAMCNGIPVVASDRGGIPEAMGSSGIMLSLPTYLTPTSRVLPSPDQVRAWVAAIVRLWDDKDWYLEQCRRAVDESSRWDSGLIEAAYLEFFERVVDNYRVANSRRNGE